MAVMAAWTAVLITYVAGVLTGNVMVHAQPGSNDVLPLDMAENSVDDMYIGCSDKMKDRVLQEYLPKEKHMDNVFKQTWEEGDIFQHKNPDESVGKEQQIAMYVYTSDTGNFYSVLNDAVRSQASRYKTTFKLHALHFFLTKAIQRLNAKLNGKCGTVYRRVNRYFDQNVRGKRIRFGSFTSTSMGQYLSAKMFGDKSCFEIITCFGADISMHSKFKNEKEVLIPPYEVFTVTRILKRSKTENLPCEVVYKLKSTRKPHSKFNCALSLRR